MANLISPHPINQAQQIQQALDAAAELYFDDCRARIPEFTQKHFSYPGAWHANKVAFGWDLVRMPANLLWAPIYLLLQLLGLIANSLGWRRTSSLRLKVPTGFTTQVQRKMINAINAELLGNDKQTPNRQLHQYIINSLSLTLTTSDSTIDNQLFTRKIEPILAEALNQYALTRTASADITNTVISTALGALMLKKFTPGGLCFGLIIATIIAKFNITREFFLGETLGGYYYSLFPPTPSLSLTILCTLGVMCLLAVIASFSGLISDPIQYHTGLHKYRLKKFISHLERDFKHRSETSFKPKDQYLARIMEVIDTIRTQF